MKPGQLGNQHGSQAQCIDGKVYLVVFGVATGQNVQHDRQNRQEFSRGCVLNTVINLFPMGQPAIGSLIKGDPWMGLHPVKEPELNCIVSHVGQGPDPSHGKQADRHAQQNNVHTAQD